MSDAEKPEVVDTPSTDVVHVTGVEPPEAMMWKHFAAVASTLSSTDFVPLPYRNKKTAIMACLAYGHELGLGPMQSLQSIDVIQGKPTLKPETMRALIRGAGHSLTRTEATAERVSIHGKRRDTGDEETVTYTIEDARALGLTGKDNWKKQPRAMLTARATSEIGRSLFSDVIMGASYTAEELGDDSPVDSDEAQPEVEPEPDPQPEPEAEDAEIVQPSLDDLEAPF